MKTSFRRAAPAALGLLAGVAWLAGCGPVTFVVGLTPGDCTLTTSVVHVDEGAPRPRVAIVDVSGMILNARRPGLLTQGENPTSLLAEMLEAARQDPAVRAVLLRINSPGGGVTASDAMFREVRRFRQRSGKPVVALIMDVGASGGYYVACAADRIVAYPTAVTGSVGVILQTVSLRDGLSRIGIHTTAFTSGPNKDAGSPLSDLSPEHRKVLQGLVDDYYRGFVEVVRTARPGIPADQFAAVTDGRVLSGTQAAKAGLIDATGDLHDAFALAKQLASLDSASLVVYHRPLEHVASPYAHAASQAPGAGLFGGGPGDGAGGTQINLAQFNFGDLPGGSTGGFYYLWTP